MRIFDDKNMCYVHVNLRFPTHIINTLSRDVIEDKVERSLCIQQALPLNEMSAFLLLVGLTAISCQTLHQTIEYYVDVGFERLDADHDGRLTLTEYSLSFRNDDVNKDGILTLQEFKDTSSAGPYADAIFNTFDYDKEGKIDLSVVYGVYEIMDTSADNEVSRREFETYYTKLIEQIVQASQTSASPI